MKKAEYTLESPGLVKEQEDLIAIMEAAIDPRLLTAVEHAYRFADDKKSVVMDISYEGTTNA